MLADLPPQIRILPHIRRALGAGAPVVALESSVFAQGLPEPRNGDAAYRMVAAVAESGAVAAITAVVCGTATVGLEERELERFLRRGQIRKISARDIAAAVVQRVDGATTVAASMAIASRVGIATLATGGIGGVHRAFAGIHWDHLRDESADLAELAHTPMVVVCSGAKAILDLPATWERLETLGVPVIGFGTDEFPGFFTASTGIPLSASVARAEDVARIAAVHFGLGRVQSVLVVQPPPANVALRPEEVEHAVAMALERAKRDKVTGADVTPYLLSVVNQQTRGRTLDANVALLEANARLAGEIARELTTRDKDHRVKGFGAPVND